MKCFEIGYGADALLYARSVAVIGVSGDPNKKNVVGGTAVLNNLVRFGYKGNIYPINPKYDEIAGKRCYPSIEAVPEKVDLVIIAVGAASVPDTVESCGRAGARSAIIISSGFAELMTDEGKALQDKVVETANRYDMRILGPNNLGSFNMNNDMCVSTSSSLLYYDSMPKGHIAWISQSGALCSSIYGRAMDAAIDVPVVVTTGNESDLQTADFIWHLLDDENIRVICVYSEGIKDKEKFEKACEKARKVRKPILVFKNGKTSRGGYACGPHTSSDAGTLTEYREFFKKCGAIMVDSLDEFFDTANLIARWSQYGDIEKFAIITTSGGSGICLTDCVEEAGMTVPDLSENVRADVMEKIPDFGSPRNPIDVTAHILRSIEKVAEVGGILEKSGEVDAMILAPTTIERNASISIANDFIKIIHESKIPALVHWYSGSTNMEAIRMIREAGIPVFVEYDSIGRALKRRKQFFKILDK